MIKENVLEQLEFQRVLKYISHYASTENGKKIVVTTRPFSAAVDAIHAGKFVSEAKEILIHNDIPPFEYIPDLYEVISRSRIEGSVLQKDHILAVLSLAEVSRKMFSFFSRSEAESDLKNEFRNLLFVDKNFENQLGSVFSESGEILDSASRKLKEIRREMISKGDQLRKVVNRILRDLSDKYLVQEDYTTQRDGRIVVPVKAAQKRNVKGFVHSESATGQTVYIEPEETLELNNEILSLSFAERREIERILKTLTKRISDESDKLRISLKTLAELDAIFAKARYSMEIIGDFPSFYNDKAIEIYDARHPILLKKLGRNATVPLNLKISKNTVTLITGPNAGGKTVVLKTLGLINLMAQSGIHIPIGYDSNLHWYENVLIDIGDKQSIEDDLSTFSSHLTNIRDILENVGDKSLVLLDEIGTGTDPAEGSALATAILIKLRDAGGTVFATTHHGNMKLAANDLEGFYNSSMEFDSQEIKPTYIFHQGLPGSSYAFEVAERIGLSKDVIELSKDYLDSDKTKVEEFLIELEEKSNDLQTKLNKLEIENTRLKGLSGLYEKKIEKLEKQKKDILEETKKEADKYLIDVNKTVEKAIKNIKEAKASKEVIKEEKERISSLKNKHEAKFKEQTHVVVSKKNNFEVGDYVSIEDTSTEGEIIDIDKSKKTATLAVGSIKLQVKLNKLLSAKKTKTVHSKENFNYFTPELNSLTLDIRGQKPEEAEFEIIKFLDDAHVSGNERIEILHGKGTGVLKRLVHDILKRNKNVKNFYFAKIEYGGEGITIVELD